MKNAKIVLVNMAIIIGVILAIVVYVSYQKKSDRQKACESFRTTTYVMEDFVSSDIASAQKLCKSRAEYINKNKMTLKQAVNYVKMSQTSEVTGHIIRLDTMEGLSTHPSGEDETDYSVSYKDLNVIDKTKLDSDAQVYLTECYTNPMDGTKVVSFYNGIHILDETGESVEAVLLRVVPVETLQEQWKFSEYLKDADLMLVNVKGGYLVKSEGISGIGFYDYLNPGKENGQTLQSILNGIRKHKKGTFQRTNRYNEKQYFVYRRLSIDNELVMIGCLPVSALSMDRKDWIVPIMILIIIGIVVGADLWQYKKTVKRKKLLEKKMKEQMGIIKLLGCDFDALWVVEDSQGTCRLFQGQGSALEEYRRADISHSGEFITLMKKYIRSFVAEKDRERVAEIIFDKYFFDLIPKDGRMFNISFEGLRRGEIHYFQMCFARCARQDSEDFVVLGFRNVDDKVTMEKHQKELISAAMEQAEAVKKMQQLLLSNMGSEG
jgi:Tfp pilus assembly protein PilE